MERFKALDGLRGVAALSVVFAHYTPATPWSQGEIYLFPWMHTVSLANIAVVFFFGLSAFLLAWKAEQSFDARSFVMRRLLRIVPLYALVILVTVAIAGVMEHDGAAMRETIDHAWLYGAFLFNWPVAFGQMRGLNELGHLWSLCVEMQFYAAFALLFVVARRASLPAVVGLALCAGLLSRYVLSAGHLYLESLSYTEVFVFCAGAGVVFARGGRLPNLPWRVLLPMFLAAGLFWRTVNWTGTFLDMMMYPLFAALICLAIWKAASSDDAFTRALAKLQWLGTVSYGIYLWHLIAKFVFHAIDQRLVTGPLGTLSMFAAYVAACIALAWLTHRFVEMPFNKLRTGRRGSESRALQQRGQRHGGNVRLG